MRVVTISADADFQAFLYEVLGKEGFVVKQVATGDEGVQCLGEDDFDAVVVDAALRDSHAFDVLRRVSGHRDLAVIFVTESTEVTDRVVGLELGADDAQVKPVDSRELVARLRSVIRRIPGGDAVHMPEHSIEVGGMTLTRHSRQLQMDGRTTGLTAAETGILEQLARAPGSLISKDELAEHALGRRISPDDRSIDTHISRLRRKIAEIFNNGPTPVRIQSIRGRGYMLSVESEPE